VTEPTAEPTESAPRPPIAAAVIYLVITKQLFDARVRKALHIWSGLLVVLQHFLATDPSVKNIFLPR